MDKQTEIILLQKKMKAEQLKKLYIQELEEIREIERQQGMMEKFNRSMVIFP
jgi:hypothetical protein